MTTTTEKRNEAVKVLLNGMYESIKTIIPLKHAIEKPIALKQPPHIKFGVLIGITGDVKGNLVIAGETHVFQGIAQSMFGVPTEGEMLISFCGELGNMLAGRLSTIIVEQNINTDISAPTILEGDTKLLGYKQAIKVTVNFASLGEMDTYLLLN